MFIFECPIKSVSPCTLIPPNSRILRLGIFRNVSLEPKISSTKSGFQTRYPLNNKNSELENSASLEPRVREGLVYMFVPIWDMNKFLLEFAQMDLKNEFVKLYSNKGCKFVQK